MPLLTICSYPGCHSPVPRGERYCERHKDTGEKRDAEAKARAAKKRELRRVQQAGNSNERGYTYRWKKLRDRFIAQHPYCDQCFKEGKTALLFLRPHPGYLSAEAAVLSRCLTRVAFVAQGLKVPLVV